MERRRILVIAGSDSSGGAGLEADQRVIAHHQCYAMTATTALTAQNTLGVQCIHHIPADFVNQQLNAVFEDVGVDVIKIGMLASAETVDTIAESLARHGNSPLVLDPVMVATSGAQLLPNEAVRNIREKLLPITTILTPNIPEAKLLLRNTGSTPPDIASVHDLVDIAHRIQRLGPKYVLVKGGHLPLTSSGQISDRDADHHTILNVFHDGKQAVLFETDYIASKNTHGTGCSLACRLSNLLSPYQIPLPTSRMSLMLFTPVVAAIASHLALDPSCNIIQHMKSACQYIEMGIRTSVNMKLGHGSGPINHFHDENEKASLRVKVYEKRKAEG